MITLLFLHFLTKVSQMHLYQREFLDLATDLGVLRFGQFTLKSGRISPYFFDAGLFNGGAALAGLGRCYAKAIIQEGLEGDMLFGPAYKGIPLVAATAIALAEHHGRDMPWCFDRKETKDHGEKGRLVGAPLRGRVLLIDDVITAGTAIRESMPLFDAYGAHVSGIVVALDRQERGQGTLSALQEVQHRYRTAVVSIVRLDDVITYLKGQPSLREHLEAVSTYRDRYGVSEQEAKSL